MGTPRSLLLAPPPEAVPALLAAHAPDPEKNITPILLSRSDRSSRHLVYVRDRERPHIHASHDLVVTLLRGSGTIWVNGLPSPMHPGDVAVIDAGTPHYFVNGGDEPSAAFVVFSPASDGSDQVFLDTPKKQ